MLDLQRRPAGRVGIERLSLPAVSTPRLPLTRRCPILCVRNSAENQRKGATLFASPAKAASEIHQHQRKRPHHRLHASSSSAPTSGGGSGDRTSGGSRGDGGGDGDGGSSDEAKALLIGAGKTLESLPEDLVEALKAGKLSKDVMQRYLNLQDSFLAPLLKFGGFRERLLADPSFIVKVGIEVGIGVFTKSTAEYSKRGKHFWQEADFVAANVAMAIVADFMLVWLPAPTLALRRGGSLPGSQTGIAKFLASCPDNAFQRVPAGASPFSLSQRFGAIARNGAKLLAVGAGSSLIGVGATQALTMVRQALDPNFHTPNPPQNVFNISAAYASYMGINSNLRYQILAGVIEERGIEVAFKNNPRLCNLLSLAVRTTNTFLGSLMWIDYLRLLGMQPKGD